MNQESPGFSRGECQNVLYLEIDANGRPHIQSYSDCAECYFDESDDDFDEDDEES